MDIIKIINTLYCEKNRSYNKLLVVYGLGTSYPKKPYNIHAVMLQKIIIH